MPDTQVKTVKLLISDQQKEGGQSIKKIAFIVRDLEQGKQQKIHNKLIKVIKF